MEYDDGVYYASAKALVSGQIPYRDFTILHPPLVPLLLAPFAAVGSLAGDPTGLLLARCAVVGVSVANLFLLRTIASRYVGAKASLLAAGLYAVYPNAVVAEHTFLLEPVVNVFVLLALYLLTRPGARSAAVGWSAVALGAAVSVKVFAAAWVVALGAALLLRRQPRDAGRVLLVVAAAIAVLWGPFVLLAPRDTVRDLVTTQLNRPLDGANRTTRLLNMAGVEPFVHLERATALPIAAAALVVLALVALAARRGFADLTGGTQDAALLWWVLSLALLVSVTAFAFSSSYFPHYAGFLAPPLALLSAGAAGWAWRAGRRTGISCDDSPTRRGLNAGVAAIVVAAGLWFSFGSVDELRGWSGQGSIREAAAAGLPPSACVYSDAASLSLAADRFNVPTNRCPGWIDGRGVALTMALSAHGRTLECYRFCRQWFRLPVRLVF